MHNPATCNHICNLNAKQVMILKENLSSVDKQMRHVKNILLIPTLKQAHTY